MARAGSTLFGQRLRQLRVAAGLTQQALAERSRVSVDAISAYENGRRRRPHPETLSMLADGLDLGSAQRQLLAAAARGEGRPRPGRGSGRLPQRAAVFLSHTADLREYPAGRSFVTAAEAAVSRAGHAISDMAYFPAHDSEPGDYCSTMVARADVYVGIIGHRYGLPVRGRPDVSYTELEFEVGTACGMPRLVFLVRDGATPPAGQPEEHRARQAAFRQRLLDAGVTVAWVATPAELEIELYHALVELWAAAGLPPRPMPARAPVPTLEPPEPPGPPRVERGLRRVRRRVAAHVWRRRLPALATAVALLVAGGWMSVPRLQQAGWPAPAGFGLVKFIGSQAHLASEALAVKQQVLASFQGNVDFESEATGAAVIEATLHGRATGVASTDLLDMITGELPPLERGGALEDLTPLLPGLEKDRAFPPQLLDACRLGTDRLYCVPWLEATYFLVINKNALPFKPPGADEHHLTYEQLIDWGQRMERAMGRPMIGLPAHIGDLDNDNGLLYRFIQGYVYPSYTGTTLTGFRSPAVWETMRRLWDVTDQDSSGYDSMQTPLHDGDVWIAWDHQARLKGALDADPGRYEVVPAPSGPSGLGHMTAVVGLAIPRGARNQAGAEALIDYLTRPEQQAMASSSLSFFPAVAGVHVAGPREAEADAARQYQYDAHGVGTTPPVGLGAGNDEFTKVYQDTFKRIVLSRQDIPSVLDLEAKRLQLIIDQARAPCWGPDPRSVGPCHIA